MFGTTFYHSFNTTIDPADGISAFIITIRPGSLSAQEFSNGGPGYPVEDAAVFLPEETAIASDGTLSVHAVVSTYYILRSSNIDGRLDDQVLTAAAVHNVTAVISAPSPQLGQRLLYLVCLAFTVCLQGLSAPLSPSRRWFSGRTGPADCTRCTPLWCRPSRTCGKPRWMSRLADRDLRCIWLNSRGFLFEPRVAEMKSTISLRNEINTIMCRIPKD
jgi:hypothetical protein